MRVGIACPHAAADDEAEDRAHDPDAVSEEDGSDDDDASDDEHEGLADQIADEHEAEEKAIMETACGDYIDPEDAWARSFDDTSGWGEKLVLFATSGGTLKEVQSVMKDAWPCQPPQSVTWKLLFIAAEAGHAQVVWALLNARPGFEGPWLDIEAVITKETTGFPRDWKEDPGGGGVHVHPQVPKTAPSVGHHSILSIAVANGHLAVILALFEAGVRPFGTMCITELLVFASANNDYVMSKILLMPRPWPKRRAQGETEYFCFHGYTVRCPLCVAVLDGNAKMVDLLLAAGDSRMEWDATRFATRWGGVTFSPLQLAVIHGHFETAMMLIKWGAKPRLHPRLINDPAATPPEDTVALADDELWSNGYLTKDDDIHHWVRPVRPLSFAKVQQLFVAAERIHPDGYGTCVAAAAGSAALVQALLALLGAGAGPNQQHDLKHPDNVYNLGAKFGNSSLHTQGEGSPLEHAVQGGHSEIIKMLLEAGADPNGKGLETNPLKEAILHGNVGTVKVLLDAGADPHAFPMPPLLHGACSAGHLEVVQFLVDTQFVDVHAGCKRGLSPMQKAAEAGHLDVVQFLTSRGALLSADWPRLKIAIGCRLHVQARAALRLGRIDPADCVALDIGVTDLVEIANAPADSLWPGSPGPCPATVQLARAAMGPWSPTRHYLFHSGVRQTVHVMLLIMRSKQKQERVAHPNLPLLPAELWFKVASNFGRKDWAAVESETYIDTDVETCKGVKLARL